MICGLIFSLLTGLVWTTSGIFYSFIAKKNLDVFSIMLVSSCTTLPVMLLFFTRSGALLHGDLPLPGLSYVIFMIAASFLNNAGSLTLQRSMVYGKNSVVWAIGQSALVVPFLAITLIFNEAFLPLKVLGTLAVLSGMALMAFRGQTEKDETEKQEDALRPEKNHRKGLFLAFTAFLILGTAQAMTASSGHFSYSDPGNLRLSLTLCGGLPAIIGGKLLSRDRRIHLDKSSLLVVFCMICGSIASLIFQFRAIDALGRVGMGGIFFPLAVGTCIAGFSLYSLLVLKEKSSPWLIAGILAILGGILCYSLQSMIY